MTTTTHARCNQQFSIDSYFRNFRTLRAHCPLTNFEDKFFSTSHYNIYIYFRHFIMPFAKKLKQGQSNFASAPAQEKIVSFIRMSSLGRVILVTVSKGPYTKDHHVDGFTVNLNKYMPDPAHNLDQELKHFKLIYCGPGYFRQTTARGVNDTVQTIAASPRQSGCGMFFIDLEDHKMNNFDVDRMLPAFHQYLITALKKADYKYAKDKKKVISNDISPYDASTMNLTPKDNDGNFRFDSLDSRITDNYCANVFARVYGGMTKREDKRLMTLYEESGNDALNIFTNYEPNGWAQVPIVLFGFPTVAGTPAKEFSRRLNHVVKKLPFFLANDEAQNEVDDVLGAANYDAMSDVLKNVVNQFKELREVEPAALKKAFELHEFFVDDNKKPKFNATCELISSLSSIVEKFDPESGQLLAATGQQTLNFMLNGTEDSDDEEPADGERKPAAREKPTAEETKEREKDDESTDTLVFQSDEESSSAAGSRNRNKRGATTPANRGNNNKKKKKDLGPKTVSQS